MRLPGGHIRSDKKPIVNAVSNSLLLVAYLSLFSVQLCFRYTSDSLDLDAFRSSFVTANVHSGALVTAAFYPITDAHHSILNKRYEPVNIVMDIPSGEVRIAPLYSFNEVTFHTTREAIARRSFDTAPLRGPPSIG